MMKKMNFLLGLFAVMLFIAGCGPIYQTTYQYVPAKSQMGKMCATQCFQTKSICEQSCQMQDQNCRALEHQRAYDEYRAYAKQQESKGKKVERSVDSFDNSYSNCNQNCHCTSDFNLCYQNCGGKVITHKQCTAFCDKQR